MEADNITLERHSRKDKFHLLRVPKGFDIRHLNGITYEPDEILQIEEKKGKSGLVTVYEMETISCQNMGFNVLVKSDDKIKVGPSIKNSLSVTKTVRLDSNETHFAVKDLQSTPSGSVSLPVGLRERFTPFGSDGRTPQERKHSSRKDRKRNQPSDNGPSLVVKRQRLYCEDGNEPHNYLVSNSGDAGSVLASTPSINKVKKHKKKKHKANDDHVESEGQINGDINTSEINVTHIKTEFSSFSEDAGTHDPGVMKSDKKRSKHSIHDGTIHSDVDHSLNLAADELVTKDKEKKKKKKDKEKKKKNK